MNCQITSEGLAAEVCWYISRVNLKLMYNHPVRLVTLSFVAFLSSDFLNAGMSSSNVSALAKVRKWACLSFNGVPTTLAIIVDREPIPVIRWIGNTQYSAGLSPEWRCKEVSARLNNIHRQGRLNYLTSGYVNGHSVICSAFSKGSGCDALLWTLRPSQEPNLILRHLARLPITREPLYEAHVRLYVSVEKLLSDPHNPAIDR